MGEGYPVYYRDREALEALLVSDSFTDRGHRKHFIGIPWATLRLRVPALAEFIAAEESRKFERYSPERRAILLAQQHPGARKSLASQHIGQTSRDLRSALGIFFEFVRRCEGDGAPLGMGLLHDRVRVGAFIRFCSAHYPAPNSAKNKTDALVKTLKWLETFEASQPRLGAIRTCEYLLRQASNVWKQANLIHRSRVYDEGQMIQAGLFFEAREHLTFARWNLRRWNRLTGAFRRNAATHADARAAQRCLIAMMVDFSEGLRREVVAGLATDRLFYSEALGPDGDGELLQADAGPEKRLRSKSGRVPITLTLRPFLEFFLLEVRPLLLFADEDDGPFDPLQLWVGFDGEAMEFNTFSREFRCQVAAFSPYLRITPIQVRRMTLTDFYGRRVDTGGRSYEDFLGDLGVYLNVTPEVAGRHYNRYVAYDETVRVQDVLGARKRGAVAPELAAARALLPPDPEPGAARPFRPAGTVVTRVLRHLVDDDLWNAYRRRRERRDREEARGDGDEEGRREERGEEDRKEALREEKRKRVREEEEAEDEEEERRQERLRLAEEAEDEDWRDQRVAESEGRRRSQRLQAKGPRWLGEETPEQMEALRRKRKLITEFQLQSIIDKRKHHGFLQYRVVWQGYKRATWEPFANLVECWPFIQRFEVALLTKRVSRQPKSLERQRAEAESLWQWIKSKRRAGVIIR